MLATNYYGATMAMILALQKVNGDLSDGEKKFKEALASTVLDAPNGKISLDSNRQAIGTNFVTEVVDDGKGGLFSKVVEVVPDVNQTLGMDPAVLRSTFRRAEPTRRAKRPMIDCALRCGRASPSPDRSTRRPKRSSPGGKPPLQNLSSW